VPGRERAAQTEARIQREELEPAQPRQVRRHHMKSGEDKHRQQRHAAQRGIAPPPRGALS
jgi:hypothetical protein